MPGTSTAPLSSAMELIEDIAHELDCELWEAERLAVAVIATIEERIPLAEVPDLEAELPDRVRELMAQVDRILDLPGMNDDAFRTRVAHRLHMTHDDAEHVIDVVLRALGECLSPREVRRVRLPRVAQSA